ncbi:MAG: Mannan endo,4-beta-mannosidase, partial [Candidatus Poribacteria bacterium]|nr:Mannan endo,4-beta-mannosidase [Candidatus Poribacteria bacterium]
MITCRKTFIFTILTCFISSVSALCAETNIIKFDKDGSFSIQTSSILKVKGSLFLWYDDCKYATPSSVIFTEPDSWSGNMPKPGTTSGHISYTQTVKFSPDDSTYISLEFHKNGDVHLTRGIFMLIELPMQEMSGYTIAFTHGPPYVASDSYQATAKGFSINLNESKALEFTVDRACIFEHRGKEGESLMNIRLSPDADAKVNIKFSIKPVIDTTVIWQSETHKVKLAINDVILSMNQVPRYSMLELTVDLSSTYQNFFDPDDVEIDALFTSPLGDKITVPGFIYQDFRSEIDGDIELLTYDGKPMWKVRFAPTEIGTYSITVIAKDHSGKIKSKEIKFNCVTSDLKGFAKITKPLAKDPPLYCQFDNGDTLLLTDHNITTYYPEIEECFKKMKSSGENYIRIWMYSLALGLEWGQPVGYYRLDEAWKLDKVLKLASQYGIYV